MPYDSIISRTDAAATIPEEQVTEAAQADSVTLKGGQWRGLGQGTTVLSMKVVSSPFRACACRHIGATSQGLGCWASPKVHEATYCVTLQNCRMGSCEVKRTLAGVRTLSAAALAPGRSS